METEEVRLETAGRHVIDVTGQLLAFCTGLGDGLVNVFVPHATAGVALMETGAGSEHDLETLMARLLPRDDRYVHRHGSPGHGADHLVPVIASPSVVIPVVGGRPLLGTWQRLVLLDFNDDNPHRRIRFSFIPG